MGEIQKISEHRKMLFLALAASIIVGAVVLYGGITGDVVKENKVVEITYLGGVNNLPLYVALEKGYFEEAGIEIKIVKLDSPNLIVDSILSGNADISAPGGPGGTTAIAQHKNPNKLKIYNFAAESNERVGTALIVKKESTISEISELNGKNFGLLPGIQFRILAKEILKGEGLNEHSVNLIELPLSSQIQALASGQVDAVLTLEPIGTIGVEKGVAKHVIKAPVAKLIVNPWIGGAGAVRTDFVKEYPELSRQVINILNKAADEVNKNPDANRKYLPKYTPLNEELSKAVPILYFIDAKDITTKDVKTLQMFLDLFTKYGAVEGQINVSELI